MVELRVSEEKSALVRAALEELRLTFWGRNDCLVRENYNDELKIKSTISRQTGLNFIRALGCFVANVQNSMLWLV